MLSILIHLPLISISGIFIAPGQLVGPFFSLSPRTYLAGLFHAGMNGDAVFPPWVDGLAPVPVIVQCV